MNLALWIVLAGNALLWVAVAWMHRQTRTTTMEIRRLVVQMTDELGATYALSHDLIRMTRPYMAGPQQEAYLKAAMQRLESHRTYVEQGRRRLQGAPE